MWGCTELLLLSSGLDRTPVTKLCTLGRYHAQIAARHEASGVDLLEANSWREQTTSCEELQAEDIFCTADKKKKHQRGFFTQQLLSLFVAFVVVEICDAH